MSPLHEIIQQLEARRQAVSEPYFVPGLWVDYVSTPTVQVDPFDFYRKRLSEIEAAEPQPLESSPGHGEWTQRAVIYNLFPRVTAAYDHNSDHSLTTRQDG